AVSATPSGSDNPAVLILGAGMAGLGAAHRLREEGASSLIFDKKPFAGGHAASFQHGSFLFDDGPHVSFTSDPRIREIFEKSLGGSFERLQTRVDNYWRGHFLKHPAPCNLHGLPTDLIVRIVEDFVVAERERRPSAARNYGDWLRATYGDTFADAFPAVYGKKYHTASAEQMTTDWLGPRLYRPSLEEVLRGALEKKTPDVHYVDRFRYPTHGGFVAFLRGLIDDSALALGQEVESVDPSERRLRFTDGRERSYRHLISSLPLPVLIDRLAGAVPEPVRRAAARLACTECILVNLGIDREDAATGHWTYFYDEDISFARLSAPHLLSPNTVPPGASSLQAEVYYSAKYRPRTLSPEEHIEPVVRDLVRCGVLREDDRLLHRSASLVPFANIIFDHGRPAALETVLGYLEEVGIESCGRYGRWGYHWTDESFQSGEIAAQNLLDRGSLF
ncbi:MAG: FAD-dependent oxidoreductase, partial [Acidobacteriota bacterium]